MSKNIFSLSKDLGISTNNIKQFIIDFDLNISEIISPNLQIKPEFEQFLLNNKQFIKDYSQDITQEKSTDEIAKKINQPKEKIEEVLTTLQPNIFDNGNFKTSISSYQIDEKLGGDYQFVYNYLGEKSALIKKDFIGYNDLYFYILDMLEPFTDPDQIKNWGIQCAAGIILYGPPGSGKIHWAKKIADFINYRFQEIRESYFTASYIDGKKTDFNDYLINIMKTKKVILFLENFNEIMQEQNDQDKSTHDNETTKDIILHSIDKFPKGQILMIGSANNLQGIDPELTTPGRFDVMIPVFPPNVTERAKMILHHMTKDLDKEATLMKILKTNNADRLPFWDTIANQMKAFSNTMVIDFTQSLKKRIRSNFQKQSTTNIIIDQQILLYALKESQGKLTNDYLDDVALFIQELSINAGDIFSNRIAQIKDELSFYMKKETPSRSIGFNSNKNNNLKKED